MHLKFKVKIKAKKREEHVLSLLEGTSLDQDYLKDGGRLLRGKGGSAEKQRSNRIRMASTLGSTAMEDVAPSDDGRDEEGNVKDTGSEDDDDDNRKGSYNDDRDDDLTFFIF